MANAIQAPVLKRFFAPDSIALVGATEDPGRFAGCVLLRMMNFGYQGKIYPVTPGGFAESGTSEGRAMQAAIAALARSSGMRVMGPNCNGLINVVDGCSNDPACTPQALAADGVAVYRNTLSCLKAVRAAMCYGEFLAHRKQCAATPTRPADIDVEAARTRLQAARGALTERASKEVFAAYGFPVTREALARDAQEAVPIAREIGGAVALKIESADIVHKTDAGAIRLHVSGDEEVQRAFDEVMAAAKRYKPQASLDGVLVQEMAPPGLEVMLGLAADPVFGPVVVAGLGGIHVEVLRDLAYRVAPIDAAEARSMLRELRSYRLLEGVRGAPPRDIDTLCDLIVRLSWLGHDLRGEISEIDINPLVLLENGKGARIVDALIVKRNPGVLVL